MLVTLMSFTVTVTVTGTFLNERRGRPPSQCHVYFSALRPLVDLSGWIFFKITMYLMQPNQTRALANSHDPTIYWCPTVANNGVRLSTKKKIRSTIEHGPGHHVFVSTRAVCSPTALLLQLLSLSLSLLQ